MKIPTPSVASSLCLACLLAGFALIACSSMTPAEAEWRARETEKATNAVAAVLTVLPPPWNILAGAALIAGGHAAAGLIRHNAKPAPAAPADPALPAK